MRGNLIICISKMATPRSLQFLYELCRRYHIKISILITGRHDIAEILLKVALNTKNHIKFYNTTAVLLFSVYNTTVLLLSVYNATVLLFSVYNTLCFFFFI